MGLDRFARYLSRRWIKWPLDRDKDESACLDRLAVARWELGALSVYIISLDIR